MRIMGEQRVEPVWCARIPDDWPTGVPVPDDFARVCTEDHEHIPTEYRMSVELFAAAEFERVLSADERQKIGDYLTAKSEEKARRR
jgi:hypothetical protein